MHRYPHIDVLRAAAALLVLAFHVVEIGQWTTFPREGPALAVRIGWVGVDLFLVISGFVIGRAAIMAARAAQPGWRLRFAHRRLRRIVPLYLLTCLAFVLLVNPAVLTQGWGTAALHVGSHLVFLHNLLAQTHGSINGPNWSVALEMQFYLLVLLCAPWLARAALWKIGLAWTGVALAWRLASTIVLPPGASDIPTQFIVASQLPGSLDQFVAGILLARLVLAGGLRPGWRPALLWGAAAASLLTLAWVLFWADPNFWGRQAMVTGWRTLLSAGVAALIGLAVVLPTRPGGWSRPLRYLGEISYGIYLWHLPVLLTLVEKTDWRGPALLAGTLGGTFALAAFSWHAFEKPWIQGGPASDAGVSPARRETI